MAVSMAGLIAACVIGGPVAFYLLRRHRVRPSADTQVEVGVRHADQASAQLDYLGVLLALLWLNLALMLGRGVSALLALTGLHLPAFVGCLLAGIALRAAAGALAPPGHRLWDWECVRPGVALISDIALGLFLMMALMGLQLWTLEPLLGFIAAVMAVQVVLAVGYAVLVVFRSTGSDYEAAVISAGFSGIALGSTATAVANMSAVAREWGAAPRAFIVVPLVCGFFIDLANALVIGLLAR